MCHSHVWIEQQVSCSSNALAELINSNIAEVPPPPAAPAPAAPQPKKEEPAAPVSLEGKHAYYINATKVTTPVCFVKVCQGLWEV